MRFSVKAVAVGGGGGGGTTVVVAFTWMVCFPLELPSGLITRNVNVDALLATSVARRCIGSNTVTGMLPLLPQLPSAITLAPA